MLSIVIVNYNTTEHLIHCLESLSSHSSSRLYDVVVVNNGERLAESQIPNGQLSVRLVNNRRNVGYAAGLNQGAALSSEPYILCLNADTRLPDGSIAPLVGHLESNSDTGLVAPRLEYPDGSLQFSCRRDYTTASILGRRSPMGMIPMVEPALRRHLMLDADHDQLLYPDWVQGSCMMMSRTVFESVGGFDERYFLYFEDYDLCKRLLQNRYRIAYLPEARVTHHYARSSKNENLFKREFWMHAASAIRYFSKNRKAPSRNRSCKRVLRDSEPKVLAVDRDISGEVV